MKYTKNLRLPIFDNPSEDKFNISNWNEGNENIDKTYEDVVNVINKLNEKTDIMGDHKGTWQGLEKPTLSEEGAFAQVEKNIEDIKTINSKISDMSIYVKNEEELIKAISIYKKGGTIKLSNDILINNQLIFTKDITFDGCGYSLICNKDGLHNWFNINTKYATIKDTFFNDNLKGRVILACENVKRLNVKDCSFTGYSKEYGYYKTDGLTRIDGGCVDIYFKNCKFFDSGYQYDTTTEDLNRCISFNYTDIKKGVVEGCVFDNVNQAIVSVIDTLNIRDCSFNKVQDNSIYTSGKNLFVDNCVFTEQYDEPIVTACFNNTVNNCVFDGYRNKAIAVTAPNMNSLQANENTFINSHTGGQALAFREGSFVKSITFSDNTVLCGGTIYTNTSPIITSGNCELFNCENNYIECNLPNDSQGVIRTGGKKVNFNFNTIKQIGGLILGLKLDNNLKCNYYGNDLTNCRLQGVKGVIGNSIEPNANYITNDTTSILFCSTKPNYVLPQGTLVFNSTYNNINSVIAWLSNGNEWIEQKVVRPFVHNKSNTPINWSIPRFPGDLWIGNGGSVWVGIGEGSTSSDWKKISD